MKKPRGLGTHGYENHPTICCECGLGRTGLPISGSTSRNWRCPAIPAQILPLDGVVIVTTPKKLQLKLQEEEQ